MRLLQHVDYRFEGLDMRRSSQLSCGWWLHSSSTQSEITRNSLCSVATLQFMLRGYVYVGHLSLKTVNARLFQVPD